ncbi:hypothetical protein B9Z55_013852 [Caenorhabditis nigoni]|uniref:Uncharacterized protein n=1 Tax=Caenorhabditis nigoni TaxID=1611254 RepID=A0A2G5U428_9PELO|nr:hypothetical protein B9Z55_013852 [Caenorhabditis nigoni]
MFSCSYPRFTMSSCDATWRDVSFRGRDSNSDQFAPIYMCESAMRCLHTVVGVLNFCSSIFQFFDSFFNIKPLCKSKFHSLSLENQLRPVSRSIKPCLLDVKDAKLDLFSKYLSRPNFRFPSLRCRLFPFCFSRPQLNGAIYVFRTS